MNMHDAKLVATPMATSLRLTKSGDPYSNLTEFRTLIGSLQYLAFTRHDIAYAVNKLSQFMQSSTYDHWQAAKKVLCYVAEITKHGIFISRSDNLNVHAFTDADWTEDADGLCPQMHTSSILVINRYHIHPRSRRAWRDLQRRLNIEQWQIQLLN